MSSIKNMLGQRIRTLRKKCEMTQDKLAELADLSAKHIGEIERGDVNLTIVALEGIARALEISPQLLLDCEHEAAIGDIREDLASFIASCSDEDLRLAYRLIGTLK